MPDRSIKLGGRYRHFKGAIYQVHHLAIDTEAKSQGREESVVVYEGLPGGGFFVRPLSMFLDMIKCDGGLVARFAEEEEVANHG